MAGNTKGVALRLAVELFDRVEVARGEIPRERWIREAIEQRLDNRGPIPGVARAPHQPGPDVSRVRSSLQAKGGITSIPKQG